jgi:gamma-glutamylcyclotransferase (GGCT)/AIG2-like uncharacterized protein YtfP
MVGNLNNSSQFSEREKAMTTPYYPVLVYGTLRPGGTNYEYFLEGRTRSEQEVLLAGFLMYGDNGCPFLTRGNRIVTATLVYPYAQGYEETMRGLDRLEGFRGEGQDNMYDRVLHTFHINNVEVKAWLYLVSADLLPRIAATTPVLEGGDWIEHVNSFVIPEDGWAFPEDYPVR